MFSNPPARSDCGIVEPLSALATEKPYESHTIHPHRRVGRDRVGACAVGLAQSTLDPVRVSIVATGSDGQPVRGLRQSDFAVKEDGRGVTVTSFDAVTSAPSATRGRSIVLMLGASGISPELTLRVQQIAERFYELAGDDDEISVVRFAVSSDEVAGSRADMRMRVAEYRASYGPPHNDKTSFDVLKAVARTADQLRDRDDGRRHAIVWIGPAWLVDVVEPPLRERELIWDEWLRALTAAGRADASVYAIDPNGLTGGIRINPDGLISRTGGAALENTNEWRDAVDRVWQETGSYYTLEYVPAGGDRALHSIEVKTDRRGIKIRARRTR
jgi:VWFA-related protein